MIIIINAEIIVSHNNAAGPLTTNIVLWIIIIIIIKGIYIAQVRKGHKWDGPSAIAEHLVI